MTLGSTFRIVRLLGAAGILILFLMITNAALFRPQPDLALAIFTCIIMLALSYYCWSEGKKTHLESEVRSIRQMAESKPVFFVKDVARQFLTTNEKAAKILKRCEVNGDLRIYHHPETGRYSLKPIRTRNAVGNCDECGSSAWEIDKTGQPVCVHCGAQR